LFCFSSLGPSVFSLCGARKARAVCNGSALCGFWPTRWGFCSTLSTFFTFCSKAEIEDLALQTQQAPHLRAAQKRLALEVTSLVHSSAAAAAAIDASAALFGQGDLETLDVATLESALRELPNTIAASGDSIAQLLVDTGLVASVSAGRRAIAEGGVYLNNIKIEDEAAQIDSWLSGRFAVLRRGKKTLAGIFKG
jgi:tyrosyl-tRNA synthetase